MLYGRDADLRALAEFTDGARFPRSTALLVVGEPGIGKSALFDEFVPLAQAAGRRLVRSRALEYDADLPFAGLNHVVLPLRDCFESISTRHREALEVVCGLRTGAPPTQLLAGAAALELVRSAAAVTPILFMIDDAPLLDRASAMAIAYVARRVDRASVQFLLSARGDMGNAFVRSGFDTYAVQPLADQSAEALLRDRFPDLSAEARARVRVAAQGNPLALLDLPATFDPDIEPLPEVVPLAARLRAHYAQQVRALPHGTQELLLFLVLGGDERNSTIENLVARAEKQGDLLPAEHAGLVYTDRRNGDSTSGIRSSGPPCTSRRPAKNDARPTLRWPTRSRTTQFCGLGTSARLRSARNRDVADQLAAAADELLARGDASQSLTALVRAAQVTPDQVVRTRRIGRAAYLASLVTGDLSASSQLLLQTTGAQQTTVPLASVIAGAHRLFTRAGDGVNAHRLVMAALDETASAVNDSDVDAIEALHTLVMISYVTGRPDLWADVRREIARVQPKPPLTLQLFHGVFAAAPTVDPETLRLLDDALATIAFTSDPVLITRLARVGSHLDRVTAAREGLIRVVEDAELGGARARQIQALFLLAVDDFVSGDWDQLATHTERGLTLCDELGYTQQSVLGSYLCALGQAVRGDDVSVDRTVEQMLLWAAPRGQFTVAAWAAHLQCLRALGHEHFDEAFRHAASINPPGELRAYNQTTFWTIFDLVEAATRSGREQQAAAHVNAVIESDVRSLSPRLEMIVLGSAALVSPDNWRELFEQALDAGDARLFPFDRARIGLAYGQRLRQERHYPEARRYLLDAFGTFTRLGAHPWSGRAERELTAAGGASEPSRLTPKEAEVARLAATGLTNKQIANHMFISPRTVSTHLVRVFAKLGIDSRHHLAGALAMRPDA